MHRRRLRANPTRQARHHVRWRQRRAGLDALGAVRRHGRDEHKYNDTPEKASRAYDKNRDGFVIAGGAGVLVLEEYQRAKKRGAKIYAEVAGYGATSDGHDMVAPSGEGAARCMQMAMRYLDRPVDYLNTHGTSTPVGDVKEMEAVRAVFGAKPPMISSTKSLTGHSLGAAGVQEAIYSILMLNNGFACESAHIEELDPAFEDLADPAQARGSRIELRACRTRSALAAPTRRWRSHASRLRPDAPLRALQFRPEAPPRSRCVCRLPWSCQRSRRFQQA